MEGEEPPGLCASGFLNGRGLKNQGVGRHGLVRQCIQWQLYFLAYNLRLSRHTVVWTLRVSRWSRIRTGRCSRVESEDVILALAGSCPRSKPRDLRKRIGSDG